LVNDAVKGAVAIVGPIILCMISKSICDCWYRGN